MKFEKYEEISFLRLGGLYKFIQKLSDYSKKDVVKSVIAIIVILAIAVKHVGLNLMDSNDRITIIYFLVTGILMILAFQRLAGLFYFSLTVTCLLIVNPALDWLFTNNETGFDILQRILIFLMAVYLLFSDSSKKNIPGSLLAGALFSYLATIDPFYALPSLGIVFAELATSKGIFAKKQPWNFIQIVPVGTKVDFAGKQYTVVGMQEAVEMKPDIAIFSAGGSVSEEWAPKFAEVDCYVVDNSSAWRMHQEVPLVVPEINADTITEQTKIIANPNCSTIQLVMALAPLHSQYKIKRVVVSTYQSITGTGVKAVEQMNNERENKEGTKVYPYEIDRNCLPHCDVFLDNDYTKEEMKLTNETKKILDPTIQVVATAVRVPVIGGHSESVNIEFEKEFDISDVRKILAETSGITVQDNPTTNTYPMPLYAEGKNDVFVGRIRRDFTQENSLNMWIVADNLRKGAATNAVQVAKLIAENMLAKTS